LQARCQVLESRVQAINAKLREKDLILEEVTELAERVGSQAESGKDVTLALAKQVNKYHSNIRNRSRQMMATISELSLFQASSIQLQQEVQRLETVVAEAEQRLEAGDAPFAEAEEEYERKKQSEERYAAARQHHRQDAQVAEAKASAQMIATTAEQRPNAYIPEDDMLGLARPYGTFAPFKPSTTRVMLTPARTEACASGRGANKATATSTATPMRGAVGQQRGGAAASLVSSSSARAQPPKGRDLTTPPPVSTSLPSSGSMATLTSFSSSVPESRRSPQSQQHGVARSTTAVAAASTAGGVAAAPAELGTTAARPSSEEGAGAHSHRVASSVEQLCVSERGLSGDSSSRKSFLATR
jgi:hypothetical protein